MKTKYYTLTVLLFVFLAFAGCDKITDPIKGTGGNEPTPTEAKRVFLVEDFTGVRCKNCPYASKTIEDLNGLFPGRVVAIGIHGGFFSPTNDPNYTGIFNNPHADALISFFGVESWPTGMVSRMGYSGNSHLKNHESWPEEVNNRIDEDAIVTLGMSIDYNTSNRTANITVEYDFVEELEGEFHLKVLVTEDKIVAPQLMPDNTLNKEYEHYHVYRYAVNSPWGEQLVINPLMGESGTETFNTNISPEWVAENCNIVAFIYNAQTQEVLQAIKMKVME